MADTTGKTLFGVSKTTIQGVLSLLIVIGLALLGSGSPLIGPNATAAITLVLAVVKAVLAYTQGDAPATPMWVLALFCALCMLATPLRAQTTAPTTPAAPTPTNPSNFYMAGGTYNPAGTPQGGGTALWATELGSSNTYAFTLFDAIPQTLKPFTVTDNIGAGIAQQLFTVGKLAVWVPTSAGVSWNGSNVGWSWTTGAGVPIQIGKSSWYVMPVARVYKSSVAGGESYQPMISLLFGHGQ